MKSDIIMIDNRGNGFAGAVEETGKVAVYRGLTDQQSVRLQLLTEEMLSMVRSVTGEMSASFWLEAEGSRFDLHLSTKTVMDKEKRSQLISAASSRKNEAAGTFLGRLRDVFEEAMTSEADHSYEDLPLEIQRDLSYRYVEDPEWDGYEKSVLRRLADDVKISIRGGLVDMTVSKAFC